MCACKKKKKKMDDALNWCNGGWAHTKQDGARQLLKTAAHTRAPTCSCDTTCHRTSQEEVTPGCDTPPAALPAVPPGHAPPRPLPPTPPPPCASCMRACFVFPARLPRFVFFFVGPCCCWAWPLLPAAIWGEVGASEGCGSHAAAAAAAASPGFLESFAAGTAARGTTAGAPATTGPGRAIFPSLTAAAAADTRVPVVPAAAGSVVEPSSSPAAFALTELYGSLVDAAQGAAAMPKLVGSSMRGAMPATHELMASSSHSTCAASACKQACISINMQASCKQAAAT